MVSSATKRSATGSASDGDSRVLAWGYTSLVLLLTIINWGDKAILGLAAQPMREEIGMTASQLGLVGSAFFLAFTIGGFFAGVISKMMTLRWSMVVLSIVWAACMLPPVISATFVVLLVSRLVLGLAEGPSLALMSSGVYGWHPPAKRGLPAALMTGSMSLGKIIVAPVLTVVMVAYDWRAGFITLAIVGLIWCALWLLFWKDGPYSGEARTSAADPDHDTRTVPWKALFTTGTFIGGACAILPMHALSTLVLTWLPSYFEVGLGFSRVQAGLLFGIPSLASLVLMLGSSALGDKLLVRGASSRVLRGVVPGLGLLICGLTLTVVPFVALPALAVAVISVGYSFGTMTFPLFNAGTSEICPPKQMAGVLGVFLALMSIGGLVAPYLTGVIVDAAATPAAGFAIAFQVFGIAAAIGGVVSLLLVNPVRDAARVRAALR